MHVVEMYVYIHTSDVYHEKFSYHISLTPHIHNMNIYHNTVLSTYIAVHINMLHYSELIKLKKVGMHTHIIYTII